MQVSQMFFLIKVEQIGVDGEAVQADLKTEENGKVYMYVELKRRRKLISGKGISLTNCWLIVNYQKVERKPRAGRKLQGQTKVAVSEAECNQQ